MTEQSDYRMVRRAAENHQAGFSLLEMIIAIAIFGIITGVVYGLLEVARNDRLTTTERVESLQSIRVALGALGRDIHNAGFGFSNTGVSLADGVIAANGALHLTADTYANEDRLTPLVGGDGVPAGTYALPDHQQKPGTDQISILYADASFFQPPLPPPPTPAPGATPTPSYQDVALARFNPNQTVRVESISPDGSTVILDTTSVPNPASYCEVGNLLVITKGRDSALGVLTATDGVSRLEFTAGADAPLRLNRTGAGTPFASVADAAPGVINLYRVHWVTYWVREADGALVRTVYGTNDSTEGITHQPIAYGIDDLQIKYVMENGDTPNTPGQAAAGPDGVMNTSDDVALQVRQVIVTIDFAGFARPRKNVNGNVANGNGNTNSPNQLTKMKISTTFNAGNVGYDAR